MRLETDVQFFKILNKTKYPQLRNFCLKVFSIFGSTYLCEFLFSKITYIKSGTRSLNQKLILMFCLFNQQNANGNFSGIDLLGKPLKKETYQ